MESGRERLLLTAAVPVGPDAVRRGYDVPKLARSDTYADMAQGVQVRHTHITLRKITYMGNPPDSAMNFTLTEN